MDEIEKLLEEAVNPQTPSKTFAQLLAENPQHKGGLAQLASAEQEARSRSTAAVPNPSKPTTSR